MSCLTTALALCTVLEGDIYRVIDGDSIKPTTGGPSLRLAELDTPEAQRLGGNYAAECDAEWMLAAQASRRLEELLAGGFTVEPLGGSGSGGFGRTLAHVRLPDGRTASEVLVEEGLGVVYAGKVHDWCGPRTDR